jgi:outer membrane murein-binding lipoprotein Lpp
MITSYPRVRAGRTRLLSLSPLFVTAVVSAAILSSCCVLSGGPSKARMSELKSRHVAFVDAHIRKSGEETKWDADKFQTEVSEIEAAFDRETQAEKCTPGRTAVKNSKAIFEKDAAVVREQHYLTSKGAINIKKQLDLNYDPFVK